MTEVFRADWDKERFYAGDRRYFPSEMHMLNIPEAAPEMAEFAAGHPSFRMWDRRVTIPCENGWSLSVIWGDATYSSNYTHPFIERQEFIEEPTTVEVGVLASRVTHTTLVGESTLLGDPLAYVTVEEFNQVATVVSSFPSGEDWPEVPEYWDSTETFLDWARCWALSFNEEHL
jgi:hypothetical protein